MTGRLVSVVEVGQPLSGQGPNHHRREQIFCTARPDQHRCVPNQLLAILVPYRLVGHVPYHATPPRQVVRDREIS